MHPRARHVKTASSASSLPLNRSAPVAARLETFPAHCGLKSIPLKTAKNPKSRSQTGAPIRWIYGGRSSAATVCVKDTSHRPAAAHAKNSSAWTRARPADGGSNPIPPARFPRAMRPAPLHALDDSLVFSRNVFSRISSTALSRGRPAARLLAMMSVRLATHKLWPPNLIFSARDRRLLKDLTP